MKLALAAFLTMVALALASCTKGGNEKLEVEFAVIEFSFLKPHEVGVNVMIANPMKTVIAISNLSSQPGAGANDDIDHLELYYREGDGEETELRVERRTSEVRRRRDPLKEGGLMTLSTEIDPIFPNQALFYQLIATHPDGQDIQSNGTLQVRFVAPVSNTKKTPDKLEMVQGALFGDEIDPAVLQRLKFRTREFSSSWHDGKSGS